MKKKDRLMTRQRRAGSPAVRPLSGRSSQGLARIHVILIVLCIVLLGMSLEPAYKAYKYHAQWLACEDSLRVVNGALIISMAGSGQTMELNEAATELASILPGRDGYCPSGGTVYFLKQDNGTWKVVCGMHDSDHSERTRLNAAFVLKNVNKEILLAKQLENEIPSEIAVDLNGRSLVCRLVQQEEEIRRGTDSYKEYSGTVAFYGVEGNGSFRGTGAGSGETCYFCFADEENSACWRSAEGWTGSSYGDRY